MIQGSLEILKKHFGYSSFKHGQEKIIESILNNNDTVCIMPTGGGKSLCYQVPALLLQGVTLVVSPLISLMKDQVDALKELEIPATFINSSLSWGEIEKRLSLASRGEFKLIYIAPERLESQRFIDILKDLPVSLLAIDEAHCVSQWGHDFRPSYLSIATLVNYLDSRPVIAAFTATATEMVEIDIEKQLKLINPNVYVTGFDRENLFFSVVKGANKLDYILEYLNSNKEQSGIIYAATRKEVDKLYDVLNKKGFQVGKYHAGLNEGERTKTQEAFSYDNLKVMIATNAFGMGIDKSNVRFVIHFNMPKNMEAYYQEAGRAGRDGVKADCILLFGASDIHIQKFLIEQGQLTAERKKAEYSKLQDMVDYCHTSNCLRKYILKYFGELEIVETCDNCANCRDDSELSDITIEVQKIFSCIKRMGEQYGVNLVANVLRGANTQKIRQLNFNELPTYGIMQEYSLNELTNIINQLVAEEYLNTTEGMYPVVKLNNKAIPVLKGNEKVLRKIRKKVEVKVSLDVGLFNLLRKLRKELSEKHNVPPYVIFHDSSLQEMSRKFPVDRQSMLSISGVGESKYEKYGKQFIAIILDFITDNDIILPDSKPSVSKAAKSGSSLPSYMVTYELYSSGKSLKEIAGIRDLTLQTVEDHIIQYGYQKHNVDWDAIISAKDENQILSVIKQLGSEKLKLIKDSLPAEISYFAIKAVICKHSV
jgi:ATP-dependent DNA helicase RecQ